MIRKPSLLIVDDEANVLFTLKLVLEEEGYAITTAGSCSDALKLIHDSRRFDAILTDLWMEREDVGLELAEAAAKLRPRPVIMIFTGYGSIINARGALEVPADKAAALRRGAAQRGDPGRRHGKRSGRIAGGRDRGVDQDARRHLRRRVHPSGERRPSGRADLDRRVRAAPVDARHRQAACGRGLHPYRGS